MAFPSPDQIRFARAAVDAGAACIIGHHPHCIQGLERYNGGLIFYSLGNFVFDFWQKRFRFSLTIRLNRREDGSLEAVSLPIWINRYYQPCPVEGGWRGREIGRHLESITRQIPRFARMGMGEYRSLAASAMRRVRFGNRLFFFANLWRFPPRFILPALRTVAARHRRA